MGTSDHIAPQVAVYATQPVTNTRTYFIRIVRGEHTWFCFFDGKLNVFFGMA